MTFYNICTDKYKKIKLSYINNICSIFILKTYIYKFKDLYMLSTIIFIIYNILTNL